MVEAVLEDLLLDYGDQFHSKEGGRDTTVLQGGRGGKAERGTYVAGTTDHGENGGDGENGESGGDGENGEN